MESSLNALIFEVSGTCGPRQKSMKCGPERVFGEDLAGASLSISSHFIQAVGVFLQAFVLGGEHALVGQVARLDLPHLLLDLFEVLGRERSGAVEIVIEAVVDGRADAELGFGIQFQHGRGQQVGGGVAVDLERLGILGGQDLERGVLFDGAGEVEHLAIDLGHDGRVGQPGADAPGDIDGTGLGRDGLFTPVGQSNFDVTHREFSA